MAEEEKVQPEEEVKEEPVTEKKKKCKKESAVDTLKAELESKNDLLIRTAAEFDNYKKRTEREKTGIAEYAKAGVIKKLLPIIDNINRASAADSSSPEYIKGIELIIKQFVSLKETLEIEELAQVGDTFDPNMHEAVMHIEDSELNENCIAEILQQGYKIGDTVIRPAMVKVAN